MPLSNDLAALIGFPCEAALWGVNATLFLFSLIILSDRPLREHLNNPTLYLQCLIFSCCTTHFALEFNHFYTTLDTVGVTNFANETPQLVGADILISLTDLFGDLVLIYRCWMLWGSNYYVIVLPLLTAIGGFACVIAIAHILLSIDPTSPIPPAALVPLGLATYALPLCTNVIVTSLIVYRIWDASRPPPDIPFKVDYSVAHRATMLIVESGALYLVFQLVFVILVAIPNPAEAIIAVMAVQIYGIAPTLIIIRVALGISSEHSGTVVSKTFKWAVRRGEGTSTSPTAYIDATDSEGMKGSDRSELGKMDQHGMELQTLRVAS